MPLGGGLHRNASGYGSVSLLVRLQRRSLPTPRLRVPRSPSLPGPKRTPVSEEEQARRDALERARRELRDVTRAHRRRVRAATRALRKAERAHGRTVRQARQRLAKAERARERAIHDGERSLAEVRPARELAQLGSFRLFEDRLETRAGAMPVSGAGAAVVPGNVVARSGFVTAAGTILRANGRPRVRKTPNAHRLYLVVERAEGCCVVEVHDEWAARDFAAALNVASLNAGRLARERDATGAEARERLAALRRQHDTAVLGADAELAAAEGDRQAVEAAERALEDAVADTGDVVRARAQLEALVAPASVSS